ncbi:MAG: hypothetical protein MI755_07410 [Sphingomonadales bacterium]|nr:hypothetical protein [Sphingomonadales bacterium]
MKSIKKTVVVLIALCAATAGLCGPALAGYEGGSKKVVGFIVAGHTGDIFVEFDPAPAFCQGGSYFGWGHVKFSTNLPGGEELYALLLMLNSTGKDLQGIWYGGQGPCSNTNVPLLESIGTKD